MDVREKLVELIVEASHECDDFYDLWDMRQCAEEIASFMIAHGVTVQELEGCKHCKGEFIGENPIVTLVNDCGIDSIVEDEFLYNFCNCGTKSVVKINFCPMCGRRLPQPPKGE